MKQSTVYTIVIILVCFWLCILIVNKSISINKNDKVNPLLTDLSRIEHSHSNINDSHMFEETDIYNIDQLDVQPSISQNCLDSIWKWECTKNEFQKYIDQKIWTTGSILSELTQFQEMIEVVINEKGEVCYVFCLIDDGSCCDICREELIRLVKNMPSWIPGVKNGESVRTRLVLPFSLQPILYSISENFK